VQPGLPVTSGRRQSNSVWVRVFQIKPKRGIVMDIGNLTGK